MAGETVTLWRPTGQAELNLVADSGWRAWPPRLPGQPIFYPVLNRWYATKITREWNVAHEGVGYVTRFDVLEYWIPAEDLAELNANIVGPIREEARYLGPVSGQEISRAAHALGQSLPAAWCDYLTASSWLSRGWLPSGCYLSLFTPGESADAADAVPGQERCWRNGEDTGPVPAGEKPGQRGEPHPVSRLVPRPPPRGTSGQPSRVPGAAPGQPTITAPSLLAIAQVSHSIEYSSGTRSPRPQDVRPGG